MMAMIRQSGVFKYARLQLLYRFIADVLKQAAPRHNGRNHQGSATVALKGIHGVYGSNIAEF